MKKAAVSLFVFAIFLAGCSVGGSGVPVAGVTGTNPVSEGIAKEAGKQLAKQMMGGTDVDFAEEGSGDVVAWPKKIPSDVPVFKYGLIDVTMASPSDEKGNSVVIQFREVAKDAYSKYRQDLQNAGWEIITDPNWTVEHISAKKNGVTIEMDADPVGENTAFLYYMVD